MSRFLWVSSEERDAASGSEDSQPKRKPTLFCVVASEERVVHFRGQRSVNPKSGGRWVDRGGSDQRHARTLQPSYHFMEEGCSVRFSIWHTLNPKP